MDGGGVEMERSRVVRMRWERFFFFKGLLTGGEGKKGGGF